MERPTLLKRQNDSAIPAWQRGGYRWGLVLILLVATMLRLGALPSLPVGLHYDEAANLILTRQIAEGTYRPLFIQAYTGKEVLFFYAAAPWVRMTRGSPWGLRLGAAMLGVLTVAATFAAVRAMFGRRRGTVSVALLAAGWMAVAFPHVLLSRYGFRAIAQPLLQALTVATLWRGLRSGKVGWQMFAGVCLGLTGYTYLAARLFPIPLALALGGLLLGSRPIDRRYFLMRLGVVLAAAVVTFAPLGVNFLQHPETFMTRITQVASPTWREAVRGMGLCLRALLWPGGGDPYVRFNDPGRAVMDIVSAGFALVGLVSMLRARRVDSLEGAARLLVVVGVVVMVLPSALATAEITPSNLRMVGIYPFVAVLPAWGLAALTRLPVPSRFRGLAFLTLLGIGATWCGLAYQAWAGSDALFQTTDGAMVLAARALDAAVQASSSTTVYIASEHYRHPTVAALATHYREAKWLTGGATLVLPPEGEAVYLMPETLAPPAPWPDAVTQTWTETGLPGPSGEPALAVRHLTASDIGALREELAGANSQTPPADFAHIVLVHDARPALACRVAQPCPFLVVWEPRASYPTLQPVVRLDHPETGEWGRTMAFHYAAEQWTPGDLVLDQLVVTPPQGMPPVTGYQVSVGFYDPSQGQVLPRLEAERFAGLEVRFPQAAEGFSLAPMKTPPAVGDAQAMCSGVAGGTRQTLDDLALLGWDVAPSGPLEPGRELWVRLCWQALAAAPGAETVTLELSGEASEVLYAGEPASGYGFLAWRLGEVIEGIHSVRLPRTLASGAYTLSLSVDGTAVTELATFEVLSLARVFEPPAIVVPVDKSFGDASGDKVRLVGYEMKLDEASGAWTVTLVWQALAEMTEDYTVFLHLRDMDNDELLAQVDAMPREGAYPTSLWARGEFVTDTHTLMPSREATGSPILDVGLYLPEPGVHLTINGTHSLRLTDPEGALP